MKLTPEQRLKKAVITIMAHTRYSPLAGLLLMGRKEVSTAVGTAATDGLNEWYSPDFIDGLSAAELRFVVLHELYHKLYRHLKTWRDLPDKRKCNVACDHVINLQLIKENGDGFAVMPSLGLADPQYAGMHAGQVYRLLPDGDDDGGGFDTHELGDMDVEGYEREVDKIVRQGVLADPNSGEARKRLAGFLEPVVDWRAVLREFITSRVKGAEYSTWKRPNRRYLQYGMYLPSGEAEASKALTVAIDTSGSIGHELKQFMAELKGIVQQVPPVQLRLLYWDHEVQGEEVYTPEQYASIEATTKPVGGGGTNPQAVAEFMQAYPDDVVIVFTDGYVGGSWGSWATPNLLWSIVNNKQAAPSVGTVVHI